MKRFTMNQLQEFFHDKAIESVLDIGTGTGDFVMVLDNVFQGRAHITGIDPGEQWLNEARERFHQPHIEFRRMEGEKLAFDDQSFDAVSMSKALHHLDDITATMNEIRRVLKPGGWLIIDEVSADELNEAQENHKMLHHVKSFVDRANGISHQETWSKAEIRDILTRQGVEIKLSFPHELMENTIIDETILNEKYRMMEQHLEVLNGKPGYHQIAGQLPLFKERLKKHGFKMATMLMVVGQFR
ncbi:class I SAM-dependent methyltransferase [Gaoshiqia sediminis]|uniref:Class I SAM-dependent methyltransferase n=1 Tax=Gaoshiqia sediminis TaxID=2986998 RepID=A0AA42C7V2_9BACT|nr:class I SAM-dependent methyltransferase [Gaoshiqia sediminis]MCW0482011.1 class I SAM-dependent methyltransferase [Gaoshiqia sediminis]